MRSDTHPALRLLAAPCLLAVTLTACSSSAAKTPAVPGPPSSAAPTAAASAAPTTAAPTSASTTSAAGATPSATADASTAPSAHATPVSTGSTSGGRSSAAGTAPGAYTYDTSGTVNAFGGTQDASGTTSFTVGALSGGSQHTTMKSTNSTTDEQVVPRSTGTYVSDLKITTTLFTVEFTPSPAALLVPSPAKAGKAWSWTATSTDGKTTATQSSKVTGTQTVVIGGQQLSTVVVQTHLVLSGGVDYTADITNWVSPTYRLVVKDHQVGKGKSGTFAYSSDLTDVLRSVRPA